jgi:predicted oxidoreductase
MQIMAIRSARNYLGDELIRTAPPAQRVRAQSVLKALTQDTRKSDDDPDSVLRIIRSEHGPS